MNPAIPDGQSRTPVPTHNLRFSRRDTRPRVSAKNASFQNAAPPGVAGHQTPQPLPDSRGRLSLRITYDLLVGTPVPGCPQKTPHFNMLQLRMDSRGRLSLRITYDFLVGTPVPGCPQTNASFQNAATPDGQSRKPVPTQSLRLSSKDTRPRVFS